MKKKFNDPNYRTTNIPAINIVLNSSDPNDVVILEEIQLRLKSNCLPLHRRIKADREFGIRSDVYPYESTFDDDHDVENQNIDVQADMRRSKWTTYAEACRDNPSRVKQSEEPPVTSGGETEPTATVGSSSAE